MLNRAAAHGDHAGFGTGSHRRGILCGLVLGADAAHVVVPFGGGQWAVQGPVAVDAALALGNDIPKIAMAVAWGDQWTNMIQPLFAIPTLAIAGLHLRDIMGYCLITLIFTGIIFLGALMII